MRKVIFSMLTCLSFLYSNSLTIGTGSENGVYFPVGKKICSLLDKYNFKCSVKKTPGSVYNILHTFKSKKFNICIAQGDTLYSAYHGRDIYLRSKITKARTIMSLHPELLTLIVKKNSNIRELKDLLKHKISSDKVGSGTKNTVDTLAKNVLGIQRIKSNVAMTIDTIKEALNRDSISAFFYMVGHPNQHISDIFQNCKVEFFDINENSNPKIKTLLKSYSYYTVGVIPKNTYKGQDRDVKTFGVKANIVVSADMSEEIVSKITKILLDNLDELKKSHPALSTISKKDILKGLGAPLHKGAIKVYKAEGLL